jgi:adenylate cyclase
VSKKTDILLIDDEDDMRTALVEFLEDEGYSVDQAKDGRMGLEYLRSHPHPDLILLDFMMPIMGGEEFCLNLNNDSKLRSIPVALVSAASITEEKLEAMKVVAFIPKPIQISEFLDLVGKYSHKS